MSGAQLSVEITQAPGRASVVLRGELDAETEAEADRALVTASAHAPHLVLDLRGLDFIDSSGLKLVLVWARRLEIRDVGFSILRGPAHVQHPFAATGLESLLPFAEEPGPGPAPG